MKRTALLVCILAAAALVASGQRRGPRIFGPDRRQPATTPQPAPSPAPALPASPAAQAPGPPAPASAQAYPPAVEYHSFMQLRFYENQGNFLVEDLEVVFPPAGSRKATFVVSKAGGGVGGLPDPTLAGEEMPTRRGQVCCMWSRPHTTDLTPSFTLALRPHCLKP